MADKQYHHGDLRGELIRKGIRLLASEGYAGFSMRRLAALCGVSHAAPYKHFKGKDEIILAIARAISVEFTHALSDAVGRFPGDPRAQIVEMGAEYVRFMLANPDYFRFVFMTDHGRPIPFGSAGGGPPEGNAPLAVAFECGKAWFEPQNKDGWLVDFMGFWSMLQGFTLMLVSNTVRIEGDCLALARALVERYIGGAGRKNASGGE